MTFKSGQSGNPSGRKPGTKNKKLELFRSNDARLQKKVLDMALDGDVAMLKIIADRLWPRLRPEALPITIKAKSSDLSDQGRALINSALSGEIPTGTLRDVLVALYGQAKIVEATELEERIAALENHKDLPPWIKRSERERLPIRGKRRKLKNESKH